MKPRVRHSNLSIHSPYSLSFTLFILFYLQTHTLLGGDTCNHGAIECYQNEEVNDGDVWEMEVDLRSREKEKRTLHWFVNGKQQKGFIKGVPDRVEFGV